LSDPSRTPTIEELLRLLLEQGKDHAIILMDAQERIVGWLGGAEEIFGYAAEEMIGRSASHIFTPEDRERGLADHEFAVARKDGRAEDDRWQLRKDGTRIWANGVLIALRDASGAVAGFGKILRDRTDVRGQIETLENRAAALLQADERKNLFLATLAHELRNPLAPLANAVYLLRQVRPGDPDLAYPVKLIERQVEFLRRLVDDLLDVTRIGRGKLQLQLGPVHLQEALRRAAEACRPASEERRHRLELLLPGVPITLEGDADRLHQVFVNLLNNAIKYTPEGGRVWLKMTVEGAEAVVRVEDTGVGIAPEMLPRIFEMFTQEASSASWSGGGLGIGLALVRDLVALHGGVVQVRSEGKGKGSEFTVRLPLKQPAAASVGARPPTTEENDRGG
jgi:PAS domain S-box-containing protein